ncbi:MAG: hypothetical protein AOA65_2039 [Candidatus Bathyarchaeota archaeon BA1]|nr:MAG: hypothetical protein AOA65_2039 [Candidatus Bathyarchaeota archaeon BA1]
MEKQDWFSVAFPEKPKEMPQPLRFILNKLYVVMSNEKSPRLVKTGYNRVYSKSGVIFGHQR